MRKKHQKQMPLIPSNIEHPRARELDRINQILDAIPTITDMVLQDLTHGVKNINRGAEGMTAEQVLRAAIIKQTEGFSYNVLSFHLIDSTSYRNFCRIGLVDKGFKKSALCKNINKLYNCIWWLKNVTRRFIFLWMVAGEGGHGDLLVRALRRRERGVHGYGAVDTYPPGVKTPGYEQTGGNAARRYPLGYLAKNRVPPGAAWLSDGPSPP